ncbi:phospholipase D-like domain-containing protein [Desulfosporosinus sp.]|uniref:phospholipase D-like domain-containing protein n=1 Tax=Desulfosporosinus sp. TaxID=157907 RepID=UPI0025C26931|nr:phospholipase D-like domain-containing protein [Desulfosporosinus sp.]MBC2726981.1 hypothetical protein [Desulfosporosinus sp.]
MKFITDIKQELEDQLKEVQHSLIIITGFVTVEGFQFIEEQVATKRLKKKILFKLELQDFQRGASSFDFRYAFDRGWDVYYDNTIHAKNYIFDNHLAIQGSSNLTSNGLGLHHERNDDNNVLWYLNNEFRMWVEQKLKLAIKFDPAKAETSQNNLRRLADDTQEELQKKQEQIDRKLAQHRLINSSDIHESKQHLIESIRRNNSILKLLQDNLGQLTEEISPTDLNTMYKYKDNQNWYKQHYIISLDQEVKDQVFDYKNQYYLYTPRIYQYKGRFYRERLYGNYSLVDSSSVLSKILQSLEHLAVLGLEADLTSAKIIKEGRSLKLRFQFFWPLTTPNIKAVYQRELAKLFPTQQLILDNLQMEGVHE